MSLLSTTDVVVTRSTASNSPWPCLVPVSCWESTLREHSRPVRVVERREGVNEVKLRPRITRERWKIGRLVNSNSRRRACADFSRRFFSR